MTLAGITEYCPEARYWWQSEVDYRA